jgi:hypothetical protein
MIQSLACSLRPLRSQVRIFACAFRKRASTAFARVRLFQPLCVGASSRVRTRAQSACERCRPCRCVPRLPVPYRHVHRADWKLGLPTCWPVYPRSDHLRLHDHDKRSDLPTLRLVYDGWWP